MMEKAYWTIEELSVYSGFAVSTLYKWVNSKKIPYVKVNGNVRFHIESIKRFLESKTIKPK